VMFVNYRHQYYPTVEDRTNMELFAHQAAVAIRNANLFAEQQDRNKYLIALNKAGATVTGSLNKKEILKKIAQEAWEITGYKGKRASFSNITLIRDGKAMFVAGYPKDALETILDKLGEGIDLVKGHNGRKGITGRVVGGKKPELISDVTKDADYLQSHLDTRSELVVPIIYSSEVVGVINVEHPEIGAFDNDDCRDLESLAAYAAVAIKNADQFEKLQRRSQYLEAIYSASKIISTEGTREQKALLGLILEQAAKRIIPTEGAKTVLGTLYLYDHLKNELTLECAYWPEAVGSIPIGKARLLDRHKGRIGITGRAALEKTPQLVPDVLSDGDYIKFNDKTRTELDVPLIEGDGNILGVLSIQADQPRAFDKEDQYALQLLAELAVVAIHNTRQFQVLKDTQNLAGTMAAVAWMGTVSGAWRHAIGIYAATIADLVELIRSDISQGNIDKIDERLADIYENLNEIQSYPMPPLSNEEGVESVAINELIRARVKQFQSKESPFADMTPLQKRLDKATPNWPLLKKRKL